MVVLGQGHFLMSEAPLHGLVQAMDRSHMLISRRKLESQLAHNIVNLSFTITNQNDELTVLLGS